MDGQAIIAVSASVVAMTQLAKWGGLKDSYGPLGVLVLSILGVAFWGWAQADMVRETAFSYFAGWIAVMTSAAGVYGFTRSTGESISKMRADNGDEGFARVGVLLTIVALVVGAACASAPAKERAVLSHQSAQTTLERLQDTERRLCNPVAFDAAPMTPITECAGPVAEALKLTTETHRSFAAHMATAYAAQRRLGQALLLWQPGQPTPPELSTIEAQITSALTLARGLASTPQQQELVTLGETVLEEVQRIVATIRD